MTATALFLRSAGLAAATPTIDHAAATLVIAPGATASYLVSHEPLAGVFPRLHNMVPTAVSQILEQIAHVFYVGRQLMLL